MRIKIMQDGKDVAFIAMCDICQCRIADARDAEVLIPDFQEGQFCYPAIIGHTKCTFEREVQSGESLGNMSLIDVLESLLESVKYQSRAESIAD